ncbi:MAG: formylglycine-generating enzyme family protein [Bacteroidetes bacterium]|nr:MAG: formylglycine-generating enzyme family protein [Bacteroidota bacterium]
MHPTPGHHFTQTLGSTPFEMIWVEGGSFWMGADDGDEDALNDEKPRHQVKVSDFWIGKYLVTQALWQEVMIDNLSDFPGPNRPVENVSWDDCEEFLKLIQEITGLLYRLPTEAEWEYTARGGNASEGYRYAGSDKLSEVGWFRDNSGSQTQPVGLKLPNELGIYDLSGNVFEWCADGDGDSDYYQECKNVGLLTDPKGPSESPYRMLRGGSWPYDARRCRVSFRDSFRPGSYNSHIGFRLALPPVQ